MVSLLKLAMCALVDLLVWVLLCVLPLFTTVTSRQDSTAQEVTTFSRGLSLPGESLLLPSFQGKSTKAGQMYAYSGPSLDVHNLPKLIDMFTSKNSSKRGRPHQRKLFFSRRELR